jgi:uncharacterized membrane protein
MQWLRDNLRQSFLAGLLALLPLYITFKVLQIVFELVDKPLGSRIDAVLTAIRGVETHIPGLGLLLTLVVVFGIGLLTRLVLFRQVLRLLESLLDRVPLVRQLYNASRQIVRPFTDEHALPFSEVVLAEYPMAGRFTLGFVASRDLTARPDDDRVVVFFPSNHLHLGYPVLLSRSAIQPVDLSVEDAIKFFVSCGVIGSEQLVTWQGRPLDIARVARPALAGGAPAGQ